MNFMVEVSSLITNFFDSFFGLKFTVLDRPVLTVSSDTCPLPTQPYSYLRQPTRATHATLDLLLLSLQRMLTHQAMSALGQETKYHTVLYDKRAKYQNRRYLRRVTMVTV
jgi:hypothetical protein